MFRILTLAAATVLAIGTPFAASAASNGCKTDMGKKSPSCEAPGQAKQQDSRKGKQDNREVRQDIREVKKDVREIKQAQRHTRGDRVPDGYVRVSHPERYGLGKGSFYHRGGDVIRVDPDTQKILAAVGLIKALTN